MDNKGNPMNISEETLQIFVDLAKGMYIERIQQHIISYIRSRYNYIIYNPYIIDKIGKNKENNNE